MVLSEHEIHKMFYIDSDHINEIPAREKHKNSV